MLALKTSRSLHTYMAVFHVIVTFMAKTSDFTCLTFILHVYVCEC